MRSLNTPPPSSGSPKSLPSIWGAFVNTALDLTINAYNVLRAEKKACRDWEEDVFTINLEDRLRPILQSHPLNLQVKTRVPVYTLAMKCGKKSPKEAKVIDIQLWGPWDQRYNQVYFAWECKLIADPKNRTYKDLPNEYIKNGIFRFIDSNYSVGLPDAGMLGYVLEGNVSSITLSINRSMVSSRRERRLKKDDRLVSANNGRFKNRYLSCHTRNKDKTAIKLHHLFLTFEFER